MATTGSQSNLHRSSNPNLFEAEGKKKAVAAANVAERKRASLDARHKYLLEKFAAFVDEKPAVLENSFIQGNKLDLVNEFFAENGSKKVLFYWQSPSKVRLPVDKSNLKRKKPRHSERKPTRWSSHKVQKTYSLVLDAFLSERQTNQLRLPICIKKWHLDLLIQQFYHH